MNAIASALPRLLDQLSVTLLHSLWIGALVVLLLITLLATLLRRSSSATRGRTVEGALLVFSLAVAGVFQGTFRAAPGVEALPVPNQSGVDAVVTSSAATPADAIGNGRPLSAAIVSPLVGLFWIAGMTLALARQLAGWMRLQRLYRRRSLPVSDPLVLEAFELVRARLGIRERVRLRASGEIDAPLMAGFLWPTVLIPLSLLQGTPASYLQAVFAHELAHHRRWDYLANLLYRTIGAVFFYHPAVWWMLRLIELERERACDDLAVAKTRRPADYLRALAWLEMQRGEPAGRFLPAPAMRPCPRPGSTADRMERLLHPERSIAAGLRGPLLPMGAWGWMIAAVAGMLAFSPDPASGQPSPAQEKAASDWLASIQRRVDVVREVRRYLEEGAVRWDDRRPLFDSPLVLEKGGKLILPDRETPRIFEEFPNAYLHRHRLDFLDGDLPRRDPDGDGFTVLEEYKAGTDPRSAESFPPLTGKLDFTARKVRLYRVSFDARPDGRQAQLTRHPSAGHRRDVFAVSEGDLSPDGELRVELISDKAVEVTHLTTGARQSIPRRETVEIPTWFAEFRFTWKDADEVFHVQEGERFRLPPTGDGSRFLLEKVSESSATILELGENDKTIGSPVEIR